MKDRASLIRGGLRGEAAVIPGQAEVSRLLHIVRDQVEDLEMPSVAKRGRFDEDGLADSAEFVPPDKAPEAKKPKP